MERRKRQLLQECRREIASFIEAAFDRVTDAILALEDDASEPIKRGRFVVEEPAVFEALHPAIHQTPPPQQPPPPQSVFPYIRTPVPQLSFKMRTHPGPLPPPTNLPKPSVSSETTLTDDSDFSSPMHESSAGKHPRPASRKAMYAVTAWHIPSTCGLTEEFINKTRRGIIDPESKVPDGDLVKYWILFAERENLATRATDGMKIGWLHYAIYNDSPMSATSLMNFFGNPEMRSEVLRVLVDCVESSPYTSAYTAKTCYNSFCRLFGTKDMGALMDSWSKWVAGLVLSSRVVAFPEAIQRGTTYMSTCKTSAWTWITPQRQTENYLSRVFFFTEVLGIHRQVLLESIHKTLEEAKLPSNSTIAQTITRALIPKLM